MTRIGQARVGRRVGVASVLLILGLSCSPELRGTPALYQLLVFPGEAELGGSAAAVISSNYIPGSDASEDYTLDRSRIDVVVKDDLGEEETATVRAVMPVAASATSELARSLPGATATLVVFDLPDTGFALPAQLPFRAEVIVYVDDVAQTQDEAVGSILITGPDGAGAAGAPTAVIWTGGLGAFELDDVVMRFRPALDVQSSGGFPDETASGGTVIAGIEADLVYFSPCFYDAEPYTGSEATNAGIHLGPPTVLSVGGGWWNYQRVVVTYPEGFVIDAPAGGAADALGEGPLLEFTFDRPNQGVIDCSVLVPTPSLWLWNVFVVRPDGTVVADQRGSGQLGETSDLFTLHPIQSDF